jgi:hypothetical protein
MNKTPLIVAALLALGTQTVSADTAEGKALHDAKCMNCHMMEDHTAMYTRADRKVDSIKALGGMVSACVQNLNVDWFPEDEKKVVDYINATWYKFPTK